MKIKSILHDIALFVVFYAATVVAGVVIYTNVNFGIVSIDKFLSVLSEVFLLDWAVKKIQLYSVILLFVAFLCVYFLRPKHIIILSVLLFLSPIIEFDIVSYIRYKNTTSTFYEENYIAPTIEKTKKNNLIVVYLESFEDKYITEEISPFLAKLKKENISFSGFKQVSETFSTIHAQFSSLCGLSLSQNSTLSGDGFINFLPNVKCIPDFLKEIGYTTAYLKAADIKFSRANYFAEQHNFDIVKGHFEFEKEAKKIRDDYLGNEFGGLKDRVLFQLAKREISKLKEPFFVSLTTLDTHGAPEVYHDPDCDKKFNDVRDAISCTDKSVENFVNWLKKQPFWNRTTVVLMGDHQMVSKLFSSSQTFNVILNSKAKTDNKIREFTTYDFAPTFLEAMGYNSPEFGIGRSLFRSNQTLFEKEGNKFHMLVAAKNNMYEELKKFDNRKALYNKYKLGTTLNNKELFKYTDFGEENDWCNRSTIISMTLNKKAKDNFYIKIKYLKMNEPFKVFANNTLIYENKVVDKAVAREETSIFTIPASAVTDNNKLSLKFDWPYNNVNRVFGLCIRELSLDDKK